MKRVGEGPMKDHGAFIDADLAGAILATMVRLQHSKAELRKEARDVIRQVFGLAQAHDQAKKEVEELKELLRKLLLLLMSTLLLLNRVTHRNAQYQGGLQW